MAKKQISNYKFFPGVVPPAYGQYPNAVALITANKDFVIQEANQYIKNQIAANTGNSGSIWYGYVYDATAELNQKKNIEYVLDGYIYDLTYGGNSLTYANASRYYINGVLQVVSGDVEVDVQTTIRTQINDLILTNEIDSSVLNLVGEPQVLLGATAEAGAFAAFLTLANIVIDVIDTGLSTLPAPVAPDSQGGGLLPNAVYLLEVNKRFVQEETIAYIQYNVDNNISPYVNYTYNAEKCRRDVSYILEGYLSDLKKGGNRQTYFNAEKYWENGVAQVDGDRQPEIYAHTFIRDLIDNFIWANVAFTARQILVSQVIDLSYTAEEPAQTRLKELSNIVLDVIEFGVSRLPTKISNRGYVKVPGFYKLKDLLLITNSSRNTIMYNFADDSLAAEITYSEDYDSSFAGALYGVDKITTITFDIDTSAMMITDNIQIFVEAKEQAVRLNSIATDAMERQKVGIPQSMLDADFEYGLQPTKWQAIGLMRNYPSIYEIPGSDIPVATVTTDASSGTSGVGASLITVTTTSTHGLAVNDPITIKALSTSVQGFSRSEGSFLVAVVGSTTQISYYAKAKVGTTNGEVLASTYTQLRKGGFYTGAAVGSPSFTVVSGGSSGTITTSLITPSGSTRIGFASGGPQIGAPVSGTGVTTGTQITAVTGSGGAAASTTLSADAAIGATTIDVTSTTGIGPGLVFNRGDGQAVTVTDVTGSTVTLSGALTSAIVGTTETYTALTQSATSGSGSGAQFSISRSPSYGVTVTTPGSGYVASDTVTILGTSLDGAAPANDATVLIVSASPLNVAATLGAVTLGGTGYTNAVGAVTTSGGSGTGLTINTTTSAGIVTAVAINAGGSGYAASEVITIGPTGRVSTTNTLVAGTGYTTANALVTTGGSGTGLTVDIIADGNDGSVNTLTLTTQGTGYTTGNGVATTGGSGTGLTVDIINDGNDGGVDTLTLTTAGTGYTTGNGVATTGGSGTGLTVNIVASAGIISSVVPNDGGTGYTIGNVVTVSTGGANATLTITDTSNGKINTVAIASPGTGYAINNVVTVSTGGANSTLTITDTDNGKITGVTVNAPGSGYSSAQTITVVQSGGAGGTFAVNALHTQAQCTVATVTPGGVIQSATVSGTAVTAPTKDFISAFTITEPTTSQIASGNTGLTFSAISTIQATFATAHGFLPGNTITTQITSVGTNAQLAAGAFFVESVPTTTTLQYTARAAGTIDNTLVGSVYGRPDSFFVHRPYDGGVQLGTAGPAHGSTAIRMSKKYIRYQSGKGITYNTGALFAPSYDLRSVSATGTAIGSIITIICDDTDHGCQVGGVITISGVTTSGYNGTYTVTTITNERQLSFVATQLLGSATPVLGSPCLLSVKNWHGATVRAGIFDDQNGMFFQYDGMKMAVCRRSSTFQIAGTISINANANTITGTNTRFTEQLAAGDRVVIRGMTHVVSYVSSNTSMTVTPDWRGVNNVSSVKITKVFDTLVPQEDWNLDTMNGSGPSGYNIDVTKMQMISVQHTWYGAGFIDFMMRGSDGNYVFVHRFRNSNVNFEAYMRTGNQPVRYEVINEGWKGRLSAAMNSSQTTISMSADDLYWFPNSGTVSIDNELISFTGNSGTALTGCTRATTLNQFVAGSSRTFSAGSAASHTIRTGVILVSNTVTPIISHWGSAFMIDGQFDADRGYIFNYAATGLSASTSKVTAFLIRLAPSVSNALIGDLGERELLNRAQLLLSSISITSDTVSGGGAIVIEGVLNPINYPINPSNITWGSLITQAAGGQPSFAQVASGGSVTWSGDLTTTTSTVQGAFSRTLTAPGIASATNSLTAVSFGTVTQTVTAASFGQTVTALGFNNNEPFGAGNNNYRRAVRFSRTDILITDTQYAALVTPIAVGNTVTQGSYFSNPTTISSITPSYLGSVYTRIVLSRTPFAESSEGSGNNVTFQINGTYGRAIDTSRSDFLITQSSYAALTTNIGNSDTLSAGSNISGRTISSVTENYITIASVSYARIIMNGNGNTSSTLALSDGANNVTVTITSSVATRFNTAISTSRNDFLITQSQYASSTVVVADVLSAATVLTGGQTISSITANYWTIAGTAYARITMSANGTATSTAGSGNNVSVTSTSAITAAYGSALSTARSDFLIPDSTATGSGIAVSDVLSISSTGTTLSTVVITGSAGQFSCASTYLAVGMRVTISGTAGGGGSITGYSNPTTYRISVTNGSTTFTLTTTGGTAIVTGAGTPTGLTYTLLTFISSSQTIASITPSYVTISSTAYTRIVMSANANLTSEAGSGNDVVVTITAALSAASYVNKNYLFFTSGSWLASGAGVSTKVATSVTQFAAGTSITAVESRTFGATTVYKVVFSQASNTSIAASASITWQFGAQYALPGEQVFSFIANPGETAELSLEALKELTSTAIGGRGTFPNGPDVLAINVYKVAGSATSTNIILRWGEAQA